MIAASIAAAKRVDVMTRAQALNAFPAEEGSVKGASVSRLCRMGSTDTFPLLFDQLKQQETVSMGHFTEPGTAFQLNNDTSKCGRAAGLM
jgi:hypothetical protein